MNDQQIRGDERGKYAFESERNAIRNERISLKVCTDDSTYKKVRSFLKKKIAQNIFKYNLKWIYAYTKLNTKRIFVSRRYVGRRDTLNLCN
jgi:hypothetical protein